MKHFWTWGIPLGYTGRAVGVIRREVSSGPSDLESIFSPFHRNMILTEEQANERLSSENNLANRFKGGEVVVVERVIPTAGKNKVNLTEEVRTEIATRARAGASRKELAEEFDVTVGEVSLLKAGKIKGIDEAKVSDAIQVVQDRALNRLMASLNLLDDDKLSGCSAKDLSVIASNMGRVVEKTSPKVAGDNNATLIIYAPQIRDERFYKVVEV